MTPATRQLITSLDPQYHEYFTERAAILQFDCKLPREEAEDLAFMETSAAMLRGKINRMRAA